MSNNGINKVEMRERITQAYRHFAWRIMVYLKANPTILNENNNHEIFDVVRGIQINYYLKANPNLTLDESEEFVDLMCEVEAKKSGSDYYVEQNEMDLYRPNIDHNKKWQLSFFFVLSLYDEASYTKEIYEMVLAEEAAEASCCELS